LPLALNDDSLPFMTAANPFPGMNPFFEHQWRDAHTSLIFDQGFVLAFPVFDTILNAISKADRT
jgi:hypothetical protein